LHAVIENNSSATASRLLASTALVAFAGAASAEVAISGSGRMGMVYDKSIANDDIVVVNNEVYRTSDAGFRFDSRLRVAFTLTQETDMGVTFGGSLRADNASSANNGKAGVVFMSGAFGKISMGDTSGAAEAAVGNLSGVGYTGLGDFNEAIYLQQSNEDLDGNDELSAFALPAALYEYTTGAASFYVSLANPGGIGIADDTINGITVYDTVIDSAYGLGAKYSVDNYSIGIGYEALDISGLECAGTVDPDAAADTDACDTGSTEFSNSVDSWMLGGSATFGGFTLKAQYGQGSGDRDLDLTQYGISGDYTFDAVTVTAFWRSVELQTSSNDTQVKSQPFGLGVTYDLGGGASVAAGVVDPDRFGEDYRADIGVNFNF
jgi:outer membrane protein OmpU